jgi:hypothetical protein
MQLRSWCRIGDVDDSSKSPAPLRLATTDDESVLQEFAAGEVDLLNAEDSQAQAQAQIEQAPSTPPAPTRPAEGQYRSDRPRRGEGYAWPKEVLELIESAKKPDSQATPDRPAVARPPTAPPPVAAPPPAAPQAAAQPPAAPPAAVSTQTPVQPQVAPQGVPAQPRPQTPVPMARPAARVAPQPVRPRVMTDRELLTQLLWVTVGAWASVLLAWLLL